MIFRALLFLTIISQTACGQTELRAKTKPFAFIDSALANDDLHLEFLDFVYPEDIQEIVLRFQQSIGENKEWWEKYFSQNYKDGEGLPYHEKMNISREEYQKIKDIEKNPPAITVTSTVSLKTSRYADMLTFIAEKQDAKIFELFKIDFKNELLIFNKDTIPFVQEFTAPASTPFGEWHGYIWKKETSNLNEGDELKIDSLVSKIIEVNFGKVAGNNKVLFRLKYKDVEKGKLNANVDMACYVN